MTSEPDAPAFRVLRNQIDIARVPFSDRGSRLVIYRDADRSRLRIGPAGRLAANVRQPATSKQSACALEAFCFVDESGEPLEFEVTTYPHALFFQTRLGRFAIVFCGDQTLAVGLPPNVTAGVRFRASLSGCCETGRRSGAPADRGLVYAGDAVAVRDRIEQTSCGEAVEFVVHAGDDSAILIAMPGAPRPEGAVPPFSALYGAAAARWQAWFDAVPPVAGRFRRAYLYAWWVMANNLVSPHGNVLYEAMVPSKAKYVGLWLWDSALHAIAYRHVDPELARNQIRAMLAHQLPNGMLPDAVHDDSVVTTIDHPIQGTVTKPPILAWAVQKIAEVSPDADFVREVYGPLVRWNRWWLRGKNGGDGGLAEYDHPYASGLDDSPLWDYGMPVVSPDLNTYLYLQMRALAAMARTIGLEGEVETWERRAGEIASQMGARLWDEEAGLFRARRDGQPVPVITPFNLLPLWVGALPAALRARLLAWLTDPRAFWGEVVIPTVARNDPHFDPQTMWRGPVWANVNYFFIEALQAIGACSLARTLREKTMAMIMAQPGMFEFYDAETGVPPSQAAVSFGWTAAVFIELAIQAGAEEAAP